MKSLVFSILGVLVFSNASFAERLQYGGLSFVDIPQEERIGQPSTSYVAARDLFIREMNKPSAQSAILDLLSEAYGVEFDRRVYFRFQAYTMGLVRPGYGGFVENGIGVRTNSRSLTVRNVSCESSHLLGTVCHLSTSDYRLASRNSRRISFRIAAGYEQPILRVTRTRSN